MFRSSMRSSSGSSLFISLSMLLILKTIKIFKKYYQSMMVMWQRTLGEDGDGPFRQHVYVRSLRTRFMYQQMFPVILLRLSSFIWLSTHSSLHRFGLWGLRLCLITSKKFTIRKIKPKTKNPFMRLLYSSIHYFII